MDLAIGRIVKVHGLRGEVVVDVRTDSPEQRFAPGASVRLLQKAGNKQEAYTVEVARWHGERLLVTLKGIADRTAAEELRGGILVADSLELEDLEDDEFHDTDLIGLAADLADGTHLGTVVDVLHTSGGELLVLSVPLNPDMVGNSADKGDSAAAPGKESAASPGKRSAAAPGKREVLIPFVRNIIPEVDIDTGRLIVNPPEGLLAL